MSWCYIPKPLQTKDDFRSGPSDLGKYAEVLEHFASHYRERGIRLGYQEVYYDPTALTCSSRARMRTTYLGMGGNDCGLAVCASELDLDGETLTVEIESDLYNSSGSISVKVDYKTENGYERSVLYSTDKDVTLPCFHSERVERLIR